MHRRKFLQGMSTVAGMAAAGPMARAAFAGSGVTASTKVQRVAVIGAGIVGAAIAYNLSKRGCEVVVIEKNAPAAQASGNSFAWINASWYDAPPAYFELRTRALMEYHRLAQDVPIPIRRGGSLEWYNDKERQAEVVAGVRRIQQSGAPTWMVDKDKATAIDPSLEIEGNPRIAYCAGDGAVDPGGVTRALLERAKTDGATVLFPAEVIELQGAGRGMRVVSDSGIFEVDVAVLAAGVDTNKMTAMAGLEFSPMRPATPGIIVTTEPLPPLLNTVVYTSDIHLHQRSDGRVVVGEKAGPPDTAQHQQQLADLPNAYPSQALADEHAGRVLAVAEGVLPALATAKAESVGIGWRPLPLDGWPVIGQPKKHPGIYIAAMHSGVTLAPLVGHLAAMEILDGVHVDLLADYRIERF